MNVIECSAETLGFFEKFVLGLALTIGAHITGVVTNLSGVAAALEEHEIIIDNIVKLFQIGAYSGTAIMGAITAHKYYKDKKKG